VKGEIATLPPEVQRLGEIATLTSEVQRLQTATDWWTNATVFVTALTALVAVGYFIVSRVAINRAAQLRTAQAALDAVKEEKLTNDLRDKDKEIADAKARAAEANRLAAEEQLARVKIEEKLAGWRLDPKAQERLIEKLKPYAMTPFDLAVNPVEYRFMETLDGILIAAGWVRQPKADFSVLLDGKASINYWSGVTIEFAQESLNSFRTAAETLVRGLAAEGIPAKGNVIQGGDPNAIHVVVGKRE
jgi:hypothetical protein